MYDTVYYKESISQAYCVGEFIVYLASTLSAVKILKKKSDGGNCHSA